MTAPSPWLRRTIVGLIALTVLAVCAVLLVNWWQADRDFYDPDLAGQVQQTKLAPSAIPSATTGGWPQWLGPNRNGISPEQGLRTDWPKEGLPKPWERPIGKGYSCLAVAAGRIYTMTGDGKTEAVLCLDADTGDEIWKREYPCVQNISYGPGPRSTPSVDGDRVYSVGIAGIMHCLKTATGDVVWTRDLLTDFGAQNLYWGVSFSPLVLGDLVYTNPGQSSGHSLVALDKHTGAVRWHALNDPAGYSSPVAAELGGKKQVVFFTGSGLVGVAPDTGELYWRFPLTNGYTVNAAPPVVVGDYVFGSSAYRAGCALLKIQADGNSVRAQKVYRNKALSSHFNPVVFYEQHLYGFDDDLFKCLKFATSEGCWQTEEFNKGSFLIADGHLIILGEHGRLALAEANPKEFKIKAAYQALSGRCWTMPALADGRLYLRNEEKIVCLDLRPPKS